MQEIYRDSTCIIYTKNKSGLYTDIYGNHIRISSVKARVIYLINYNVIIITCLICYMHRSHAQIGSVRESNTIIVDTILTTEPKIQIGKIKTKWK